MNGIVKTANFSRDVIIQSDRIISAELVDKWFRTDFGRGKVFNNDTDGFEGIWEHEQYPRFRLQTLDQAADATYMLDGVDLPGIGEINILSLYGAKKRLDNPPEPAHADTLGGECMDITVETTAEPMTLAVLDELLREGKDCRDIVFDDFSMDENEKVIEQVPGADPPHFRLSGTAAVLRTMSCCSGVETKQHGRITIRCTAPPADAPAVLPSAGASAHTPSGPRQGPANNYGNDGSWQGKRIYLHKLYILTSR